MGGGGSKIKGIKKENPTVKWQILSDLGSGTYGKVHMVRSRTTSEYAAAKIAPIDNEAQLANFASEVAILVQCKHDNITNFVDGYYFDNSLWIIIEMANGGSLNDILSACGGFPEPAIAATCNQMTSALAFLHEHLVIHRDLNASNTLITDSGVVKIADFGVSAFLKSERERRSTFIGSPNWMAPEVVACENDRSKPYTTTCDVWSLAITMIELAETRPPHSDLHPIKVLFKISAGAPPRLTDASRFSPLFSEFLAFALVKDPTARPSMRALSQHAFCRGHTGRDPLAELVSRKLKRPPPAATPVRAPIGGAALSPEDDSPVRAQQPLVPVRPVPAPRSEASFQPREPPAKPYLPPDGPRAPPRPPKPGY